MSILVLFSQNRYDRTPAGGWPPARRSAEPLGLCQGRPWLLSPPLCDMAWKEDTSLFGLECQNLLPSYLEPVALPLWPPSSA